MAQVSFIGTGTAPPDQSVVGTGQGLQVGVTEIDFEKGTVNFMNNLGQTQSMGRFTGLYASDSENALKSLVFKAKVPCTIVIDQNYFNYDTINQYITFNKLEVSRIKIIRTPSGQNPDVFDWTVIGSDDPDYRFTIQAANKQSDTETVFAQSSRAANTYTQTTNLRGARKIIIQGESPASAETGVATVTMEVFNPATGNWNLLVPNQDLFTLAQGQAKVIELGDTVSKSPITGQYGVISPPVASGNPPVVDQTLAGSVNSTGVSALGSSVGHILPSGDNLLRVKVVVATAALTFSISIIKVFD